jgi:hypothetical protein
MNHASSFRLARNVTEDVFAVVRDALRGTARAWTARRRARQARRSQARALDAIAGMSDYLLRDIGAPDWMIGRATLRNDTPHRSPIDMEVRA